MDETRRIIEQALPAIESWLRATVSDEVSKALEADRVKRQFVKRYTRKEAAEALGISVQSVDRYLVSGRLTRVRYSARAIRISAESVYNLMKGGEI